MTQDEIVLYFVMPAVGFALGSIPFAFVIGKMNGVDIRTTGSKNVGATNLGRTMGQLKGGQAGKKYFFGAFLLDAAKGFVPTLAAVLYLNHLYRPMAATHSDSAFAILSNYLASQSMQDLPPGWTPLLTACAAVLGHLFPPWLRFRGGKGVATTFGAVLGMWPLYTIAAVFGGLVFVGVLMIYRFISLASITASVAFVGFVTLLGTQRLGPIDCRRSWPYLWPYVAVAGLFSLFIILRHRGNIVRLMNGTEPQVGQKEIDKSKL